MTDWQIIGDAPGTLDRRPTCQRASPARVHPRFKTQYRVKNWKDYEAGLRQRGDLTIWFSQEAIEAWTPKSNGQPGGQCRYSDVAILAALSLRLIFHLPLRQTEGFVDSLFRLLDLDPTAPDHTTLSRRHKEIKLPPLSPTSSGPLHLIVDSTGLKIKGAGEWSINKHGRKRRCWRKLHLGVNAEGEIVAQVLTNGEADDSTSLPGLLQQLETPIQRFTADGGYDNRPVYEAVAAAGALGVIVVIPPSRRASISEDRGVKTWKQRNEAILQISDSSRRDWQRESGYRQQARVENTFLRFKQILRPRIRSRHRSSQAREVLLGCHLLNRMFTFGRPKSETIAA